MEKKFRIYNYPNAFIVYPFVCTFLSEDEYFLYYFLYREDGFKVKSKISKKKIHLITTLTDRELLIEKIKITPVEKRNVNRKKRQMQIYWRRVIIQRKIEPNSILDRVKIEGKTIIAAYWYHSSFSYSPQLLIEEVKISKKSKRELIYPSYWSQGIDVSFFKSIKL